MSCLIGVLKAVLKREYSACAQHVVTPCTKNASNRTRKQVEDEEKAWGAPGHDFSRPQWFLQPYIPPLKQLGELRTFVINGHLMSIVYTVPSAKRDDELMEVDYVQHIRPLHKLRHVCKLHTSKHPTHFSYSYPPKAGEYLAYYSGDCNIINLDFNADFHEYVMKTVGKLIMLTERQTGRFSDLRIMCRLDVSVFWDLEKKEYVYFANEVTQGLNTTLFVRQIPARLVDDVYRELEVALYHVIRDRLLLRPPPSHPAIPI